MTVIIGVNLSDKVYVAGDSRLSYQEDGKTYIRHDNMQKVEPLPGTTGIVVACAGDAGFANYLLNQLVKAPFISGSISDFRNQLEGWLRPTVDKYFSNIGYSDVTLIFGGSDQSKRKVVSGEQMINLANSYTGGRGVIKMNPALQKAFEIAKPVKSGEVELELADTQLFSVRVNQHGIKITDTKWGEFLIYGPEGLVKDDIGTKEIGSFEFDPHMQDNGSGTGNDIALLNAFIYSLADKSGLSSVGGSVVTFAANSDKSLTLVTGTIQSVPLSKLRGLRPGESVQVETLNTILMQGSTIYREVNGTRHKLIKVSEYKPSKTENMLL